MKFFTLILLSTLLVFQTGCMTVSGKAAGFLYTDSRHGEEATSNKRGAKTGKACQKSILGLVATGDASIEMAKENGRIRQISSVDAEVKNYLGLYGTYCTIVRGD